MKCEVICEMLDVVTALAFDVAWESLLHFMELLGDGDGGIQECNAGSLV